MAGKSPGRQSAAAQGVTSLVPKKRPQPPAYFTPEKAAIWKQVVNSLIPDWFSPSNLPLLESYCGHVSSSQFIDRQIDAENARPDGPRLNALATFSLMKGRETRAIAQLATKMRLSQQSSYDKSKKGMSSDGGRKKPWEQ